jgi:hypothetical protein
MAGGTVFFDANFNGVKDENEPFSITNADGSFDLDVSLDKFDKNNSGDLEPAEGKIALSMASIPLLICRSKRPYLPHQMLLSSLR